MKNAMKKIYAIILAGCGPKDGSEIQEAIASMMAVSKSGCVYRIFAPNINQADVINHLTNEPTEQKRNVLTEAARIARGDIHPIEDLSVNDFDGLILPGGFGAAKNLFTFAFDGLDFSVLPAIEKIILAFHTLGKPIGAMCISPVMIAKVLGHKGVKITLGPPYPLCEALEKKYGAIVRSVDRSDALVDRSNKVVTTPSYMYGDSTIADIAYGAERMIEELIKF
jgi:enhancing lycopene biosynthesis protein 2